MSKNPHNHGARTDIQALRALAILAVLIFHVWPFALSGGYVGVDIFFVISGYLITGQLWRQEQRTGKVDFRDFWARRARRLLPASLLVIAVTTVATYFATTASWFSKVHDEAYGATGYFQNWVLVKKVTDYLTDDGTKSPFQHFWSLSVEEQYYIFWPLILFVALLLVRTFPKFLKNKVVLLTILSAILVGSFAYSVWLTRELPKDAYFNTFTRAWEFAAGALLAIGANDSKAQSRSPLWYLAGVGLMLWGIFGLTSDTPFPSFWAAIPVLGTVLTLHGGQSASKLVPSRLLAIKPIQFIGDISYSLYLWHWPILILTPWVLTENATVVDHVLMVVASVILAWLSKRFVEDPMRFGWLSTLKAGRQLAVAGLAMAVIFAGIFGLNVLAKAQLKTSYGNTQLQPPLSNLDKGARARESGDCKISREGSGFLTCQKGDPNGKIRVALIGDSHTREWFVPVDNLAFKYHWNLTMISKSACTLVDPAKYPANLTHYSCKGWNEKLNRYLASKPPFDLIINSNSTLVTKGRTDVAAAFASQVKKLTARGTTFLVIHDTPKPKANFIPCIEMFGAKAAAHCSLPRHGGLTPYDTLPGAVKGMKNVKVVNFTNLFCGKTCSPVIGRIIVYRDNSHITTTWAEHLQPQLDAQIPQEFKR